VEDLAALASANQELFFSFDQFLAKFANRRVYLIIAVLVHSQAEVAFTLRGSTVAFGERGLE